MLTLLTLLACSDTGLNREGGTDGLVPILALDPMIVDFGAHPPDEATTETVTVTNVGDSTLTLTSLSVDGSTAFTLLDELPDTLTAGESATVDVVFTPQSQKSGADLVVTSDAPASPVVRASLRGEGQYPALAITPKPYDLGSVAPGCEKAGSVDLVNVGTAPLTVTSAVVVGAGFTTVDPPAFPLVLEPDASVPLGLAIAGDVLGEVDALLYVASDDAAGVTIAPVSAYVESPPDEAADHLVQPYGDFDQTDILVYVDQSGSMADDQARLAANFSDFAYNLEASSMDWQVVVATADDGCASGGIFSPFTADVVTKFSQAVRGSEGRFTEAGLTIADHALQKASGSGCNAGFLRDGAKTLALLVSDEPEQSPASWDSLVFDLQALAPTISIAGIVGPAPRGCATAELGSGYIEAAGATAGVVYSICEPDWTDYFQELTSLLSDEPKDRLVLDWVPELSTLQVTLDGAEWTEWSWNADENAIVFNPDAIPQGGQRVEATYLIDAGACL